MHRNHFFRCRYRTFSEYTSANSSLISIKNFRINKKSLKITSPVWKNRLGSEWAPVELPNSQLDPNWAP